MIKKKLLSLFLLLSPILSIAHEEVPETDFIEESFAKFVGVVESILFWDPVDFLGFDVGVNVPIVVVWLVIGAIIFTFSLKFLNIKGFKHAIQLVRGVYDDPNDKGEVSHFQALTTALSGTVGLGNIASVAVAISLGGPGATFWMIVAGFLGMSSKFVECTLGVKYRKIDENGVVHGGPMYYLSEGLTKLNLAKFGKILAVVFAVLCIGASFGGGNMFQSNQAFSQVVGMIPEMKYYDFWFGLLFAGMVGVVIIGGIKSIAKVTDKIVPFMCGLYVLTALFIIFMNFELIDDAIKLIVKGAFSSEGVMGGIVGVMVQGFKRAAFSNEAGIGSASIAHAAAKTHEPVSEGIVALLEPFIDTVVVCTMTAIVIVITGAYQNPDNLEGAQLTSQAFGSQISWFPIILTLSVVLFAFSTMISWSYYGLTAWSYLFGKKKVTTYIYKFLFLVAVICGVMFKLDLVINFSDLMLLGMAFPNILGLYFLLPQVKKDVTSYFSRIKSGEIKRHK